jgi:two-component system, chemotaxis family, protein-glutamate methylesterase/glutaminase
MIKVLVVEDSPVAKEYLIHILSSAPGVEIIGTAANGREALEAVRRLNPDVVTMDINMPVMDGLEATRRIMETNPVPIVIVSGNWNPKEVETTFRAIEAGALAVVQRPVGIGHPDAEKMAGEMVLKVRLMSEVKVVRRWDRNRAEMHCGRPIQQPDTKLQRETAYPQIGTAGIDVVAIGASTGGPMAIKTILNSLPKDFPASILIVQHIAAGFLRGMVDWLTETSAISLRIAADGEVLLPGHVYFAPDGFNVGVRSDGRIYLDDKDANQRARPSVSHLFRSVAEVFGGNAAGILLSGMGRDGAEELKLMKEKGQVTIAQDRESSVIYGMPGAAVELGAAMYVLSPDKIAAALNTLTRRIERGQGRL